MTKRFLKVFSIIAIFAMILTLVSCKKSAEDVIGELEEAGFTVEVQEDATADAEALLVGLTKVDKIIEAQKGTDFFFAILFDDKEAAEAGVPKLESLIGEYYEVCQDGEWVYYGAEDGKKIFE